MVEQPEGSLITVFDEFFRETVQEDFNRYRQKFSEARKWTIASDYYFEEIKSNHVVTYTVFPHIVDLQRMMSVIGAVAPRDIKHTREISDEFLKVLKWPGYLHISFIVPNSKFVVFRDQEEARTSIVSGIDTLLTHIPSWILNNPAMTGEYRRIERRLKHAREELERNKKVQIYSQMFFCTLFLAYIAARLGDDNEIIGWLSDRDKINEAVPGLSADLFSTHYTAFNYCETKLAYTQADSTTDNWYDEIVRLPDFITGTLADYNMERDETSIEKFVKMLREYFAEAENLIVVRIKEVSPGRIKFFRVKYSIGVD